MTLLLKYSTLQTSKHSKLLITDVVLKVANCCLSMAARTSSHHTFQHGKHIHNLELVIAR